MKKTIQIEGMSCQHCVHAVAQALAGVEGITVDQVEIGSATVEMTTGIDDLSRIKRAIEDEGYVVVDQELS